MFAYIKRLINLIEPEVCMQKGCFQITSLGSNNLGQLSMRVMYSWQSPHGQQEKVVCINYEN